MMAGERWRSLRASVRVRTTAAAVAVIGVALLVAAVALSIFGRPGEQMKRRTTPSAE